MTSPAARPAASPRLTARLSPRAAGCLLTQHASVRLAGVSTMDYDPDPPSDEEIAEAAAFKYGEAT